MQEKKVQELLEIIQSSNINFLMGAGISTPFLPLLGSIEKGLNEAKTEGEKEILYKEYFNDVMLPNKEIISRDFEHPESASKFLITKTSYETFFHCLSEILLRRKNTILSKQINLFTTNIDVLMETVLESLGIEYNDGFSGRFHPVFSIANFKKAIYQRSLHFEHISEIPVCNVVKIHGSLSWVHNETKEKILFSHSLQHFDKSLSTKSGADFLTNYKNILVVNPEESKHLESVLNVYYSELLRLYSSELEKENALLFVIGFSMEDKHIKEITLRAAKSNPTLRIFICCSQNGKNAMGAKMEIEQHPNIQIFTPENDTDKFTLDYLSDNILKKIIPKRIAEKNAD